MFSFLRKKSLVKRAALMGAVPVLLIGLLFVSCADPDTEDTPKSKPDTTPVSAQEPTISVQPIGGSWNIGTANTFELTVTVADVTDGGDLSYQWYSNSTDSNSNGTALHEEKETTLTLDKAHHTANGNYYFYVVVTNTNNNATGAKTATATSDVATVTVTSGVTITAAEEPNITAHPADGSWNVGTANTFELTVTVAEVADGGTLSYKWYSNTSATTTGGTEIGTNNETLTLAKANYTANGNYYFYVVVTNTNNNATTTKVKTKTSNAVTVTVSGNVSVPAATPSISKQPDNTYWDVSVDTTKTLTVTATVSDGGSLSYQWYRWYKHPITNVETRTLLPGKTDATLSLTAAEYPGKTSYYRFFYCVVTNTLGATTATATSDTARVIVTGHTFVLENRWIGTWEPDNHAGDYFWIASDGSAEYDIFSIGMIPSGSPSWGWTGKIYDIVYWDESEEEGVIFQKYDDSVFEGSWQTVGNGNYTGFYFGKVSEGWYYMLNLALGDGSGWYGQQMYTSPELAMKGLTPENIRDQLIVMITYTKDQ
jgi:hypothetical protein